ncbi:MAG TPA: Na+/H+ antiporter NhaA [Chthoniobacterales bacterium]|nr:Na+/H+ antiporter NhaA [Chthoniobacterales bacterium]
MERSASFFQRFFRIETLGGLVLLLFAIAALILANSPLESVYRACWQTRFSIGLGNAALGLTLQQWINDGLMALFFLLVGLEIKRELLAGELASLKQATLPIAAAVGGMAVPAALYWSLNRSGPAADGWGIPMATDIAFALGALALIAPHAPTGLKVFLAALAIADDMGAILVIAIFYSGDIAWSALGAAGGVVAILVALNLTGVVKLWPYVLCGMVLWFFVHESGIHATIAGVALAMAIPTRTRLNAAEFSREARALLGQFDRSETGDLLVLTSKGQQESLFALERASEEATAPILRLEHALHRFSAFAVMPLFALANAGVHIGGPITQTGVALGVTAGLVIGKPLGIFGASVIAVKCGLATLPEGMRWGSLLGAACLAGIGFTMSLFIAMLAFGDPALIETAKVAVLAASLLAGVSAAVVLNTFGRVRPEPGYAGT